MKISEIIDNASTVDITTVLNSVWTDRADFCCESMDPGGAQMLVDMTEVQSFIAALHIAEQKNIAIPKFKAEACADDCMGMNAINVDIMSPVNEDFAQLLYSIEDGEHELLSTRTTVNNIVHVHYTDNMKNYIFSRQDNINIINATLA